MSRLRRFLPPQVADLIVASGNVSASWKATAANITALFCDLGGVTSTEGRRAPTRKT